MGPQHPQTQRTIAAILTCLLSSIVLLGASSGPPVISIPSLSHIESGSIVKVFGILVEHKKYESGAEGLTLADLESGAVVRAISSQGVKPQPSLYARIGDQLLIKGEVSMNGSSVTVFAKSDDVAVTKVSELALSVSSLSRNWQLFDEDTVRIKGLLEFSGSGSGFSLRDPASGWTITVLQRDIDLSQYISTLVTLTVEVRYDYSASLLTLMPLSAACEQ